MTPEPGATKTLSTILRNSATTSMQQVQQLQYEVGRLQHKVALLEAEVRSLKTPVLMYRPPGATDHMSIVEYLNSVEERLTCRDQ